MFFMFAGSPLGNFLKRGEFPETHFLPPENAPVWCFGLQPASRSAPGSLRLCSVPEDFILEGSNQAHAPKLQCCTSHVHTSMQLPLVSSSNKVWVSLCKTNEMWGRICSLSAFFSDQTSDVSGSFSFHLSFITEETPRKSICSVQALEVGCSHGFCSCGLLLPNLVAILQHV